MRTFSWFEGSLCPSLSFIDANCGFMALFPLRLPQADMDTNNLMYFERSSYLKPSCLCLLGFIWKLQDLSRGLNDVRLYSYAFWSAMDGLAIFINIWYTGIPTTNPDVSSLFWYNFLLRKLTDVSMFGKETWWQLRTRIHATAQLASNTHPNWQKTWIHKR